MGASRYFDGGDWIKVSDADVFSFTDGSGNDQPFSFSGWVYLSNYTGDYKWILSKYNNGVAVEWDIFVNIGSQQLWCVLRSSDETKYIARIVSFPAATYTSTWANVVFTYDGSENKNNIHGYLNGVLTDTSTASGGTYAGMSNTATDVIIGARQISGSKDRPWIGNLADFRLYNRVLSANEILELASGKLNAVRSGLIAEWPLDDEGASPTYRDLSGNGRTGSSTSHPTESYHGPRVFRDGALCTR